MKAFVPAGQYATRDLDALIHIMLCALARDGFLTPDPQLGREVNETVCGFLELRRGTRI